MLWSRAIVREFAMVRRLSLCYIGNSVFLSFVFTLLFLLGDIKCENVLVTSWNWLYLTDFASFKPTYIPDDDPSDFSFFFDTGGRRRCYLAPEVSPFTKIIVKISMLFYPLYPTLLALVGGIASCFRNSLLMDALHQNACSHCISIIQNKRGYNGKNTLNKCFVKSICLV
jgi:serine/threonine protein kinase